MFLYTMFEKCVLRFGLFCRCSGPGSGSKELCLHLLFTMLKVLRVPASNPLVWQLSLTGTGLCFCVCICVRVCVCVCVYACVHVCACV